MPLPFAPPAGPSVSDGVQADIQEIKKMLQSRSEATRNASNISSDDLQAVLISLKCRVISVEDQELEVMEDVEYAWAANKYEPQQQEEYLQALEQEACSILQQHSLLTRQTSFGACLESFLYITCHNLVAQASCFEVCLVVHHCLLCFWPLVK